MNILEALNYLNNIELFSNFLAKTDGGVLSIARNLYSKTITITGGTTDIGAGSQYDQKYSIACENANITSVTVEHGNVGYSGTLTANGLVNDDFSEIKETVVFEFDSLMERLGAYSTYLMSFKNNVTKRYQAGVYSFTGSNDINFITIDTAEMTKLSTTTLMKLNFKKGSIVIFNFVGNNALLYNAPAVEFVDGNIDETSILFNLGNCTATITGSLYGSILYSSQWVALPNATVYGSIYSNHIYAAATSKTMNSTFAYVSKLPVEKATPPDITVDIDYEDSTATVTVEAESSIRYSIDGGDYEQYTLPFTITSVGNHTISAYSEALSSIDSEVSEYSFEITCDCTKPTFEKVSNGVRVFSNNPSSRIHYTLDGKVPSISSEHVNSGDVIVLVEDGYYTINAFAVDDTCASSGISSTSLMIEYPEETVIIEILSPANVEGTYQDVNGLGVLVGIKSLPPGPPTYYPVYNTENLYYSIDGSDPTNGILYTGPFYTNSGTIKAISKPALRGYSNITTLSFDIGGSFYIPKSPSHENSLNKFDLIASTARSFEDIGWIGPTVIVDDTAIYQALVNILSTPILEIPFNPSFGVSIHHTLFELSSELSSDSIIKTIKREIEYNDPRIFIDQISSFAYFSADINKLVIELDWKNRYTGEMGHVRYGYSLDGPVG